MQRVLLLFFVALVSVPRAVSAQGNPLGPEFRVNTYTTDAQRRPWVASDAAGNFVVVWDSRYQDGSGLGVFGQRFGSSGTPLGQEFRVNTTTASYQDYPTVAADSSGDFVVVWDGYGQDGANSGVFGQRYASSGIPLGPEFRVNTYTTGNQQLPAAAFDSSGNFVVVWESQQDGSYFGVFGQRYASTGSPVGAEFRVNTYTTDRQDFQSVVSDSAGNFVVVWESSTQDGSSWGVFGQRYASSGAPLGPQFRVNTHTTGFQDFPSVAADTSGNFVIVWRDQFQDGSGEGIFGQRYASSGAPLGPEFQVNTYMTGDQAFPAIASDSSGNFVVTWRSNLQDGSQFGVFGQRYDSSGVPLGPEFRVNTYTTNQQGRPSVAADSSGDFVVVWPSNTQDGSDYGAFGQRYGQIVPVELMRFGVE